MSDLRTAAIRLAASMPKGSVERKALLEVLAGAKVKKLPSAGTTQRWSVMDGDTEIGKVEKNRSTKTTLEPYHAILVTNGGVTEKDIGAFYDKAESEKKGPQISENTLKSIKWGGLDAAVKAVEDAAAKGKKANGKTAANTWLAMLEPVRAAFMLRVVAEGADILKQHVRGFAQTPAWKGLELKTGTNGLGAYLPERSPTSDLPGGRVSVMWNWDPKGNIVSTMSIGREKREGLHMPLSMSAEQIASESMFKHFQGLLP